MNQVKPPLEFIPPNFNPLILRGSQFLLPFWLKYRTAIANIQTENVEVLVDLYRQFQAGKIRFLIAFRHPSASDPYALTYLLWKMVPQVAKQQGISLNYPIHAHFIYDRGIPLWAGEFVSWLYPKMGGTPIHRGKVDRAGLRSARELFSNGQFPMMAAPEGATNGHNEVVSPLEPGISQMAFWCAEDLLKAGRSEQVFILPVGIKYHYVQAPWQAIEKLLEQLEIESGLPVGIKDDAVMMDEDLSHILHPSSLLYRRLYRLGEHILTLMEDFYTRFYHQTLPKPPETTDRNELLAFRLKALLDAALQVAEKSFNLPPKGSAIDRCRRLEQAGWDWIFREDIKNLEALSVLERGLADRVAAEASLRMWHMRLVESFVAVTGRYVLEKPTAERFAETTLLLWDMLTRIKGGNPFGRPQLGKQGVKVTVGQPISVSSRWDDYHVSRRKAVADLTQDLQTALERAIAH